MQGAPWCQPAHGRILEGRALAVQARSYVEPGSRGGRCLIPTCTTLLGNVTKTTVRITVLRVFPSHRGTVGLHRLREALDSCTCRRMLHGLPEFVLLFVKASDAGQWKDLDAAVYRYNPGPFFAKCMSSVKQHCLNANRRFKHGNLGAKLLNLYSVLGPALQFFQSSQTRLDLTTTWAFSMRSLISTCC